MACDFPRWIKYNPPKPDGKGGVVYGFPGDCGKCLNCLRKRKAQWSYRLTEEKRNSFSGYFVTLTYTDKTVPQGDGTLTTNANDHFNFIKELKYLESQKGLSERKGISIEEYERKKRNIPEVGKLKYFGISEYGDKTQRPHWHYLLFNVRDINNIVLAWANKGNIDIDPDVNVNNIDYVLKYMCKDKTDQEYETRGKELQFISKGLGISAADKPFIDYVKKPSSTQLQNARGFKISIPRYYKKKFLSESERLAKNLHISEEVAKNREAKEKSYERTGHNIFKGEVLGIQARQEVLKSRAKRLIE